LKRNELDEAQATLFDNSMSKWQARLNLSDWRVERSKKRTKAMASMWFDHGAKLAAYNTGDFGAEEITPASIDETALHEMLHVLLADFAITLANTDNAVLREAAEHRVVNTLEKLGSPE
jgi:hypothetical protein